MLGRVVLICTLLVAPSPLTAQAQPSKSPAKSTASAPQKDAAEQVFAKTASKIVFLITRKSGELNSRASGMILSADGYIATNYHALQGADSVEVRFFPDPGDSKDYQSFNGAKLLYADPDRDIAVLKVNSNSLPFLKCPANTGCEARVGEKVYAIGNPKGLSNTISDGIVSGLRSLENEDIIQHTAPISPGSSGGALVDSSGALLGMNSWQVADGQNLNFAISSRHLLTALASARQTTTALAFPPAAGPSPTDASSLPSDWVFTSGVSPDQVQDIQVRVVDDYVYIAYTISAYGPNFVVKRKETCNTRKTGNKWEGVCIVALTAEEWWDVYSYYPICSGIEHRIVITLLTPARIEGSRQYLEFPTNSLGCPIVHSSDWRTFQMIPKL
jgi:hypothetical protein